MEVFNSTHFDANESVFFARELEYIKAKSYDIVYPRLKALVHLPISGEAGPGAASITFTQYDSVGTAKLIANYADDLPRADVRGKQFTSTVKSIGGSFGYNLQELREALFANKPLSQRKANAARMANDQLQNKLAWFGDTDSGLVGLVYNANVTKGVVLTGAGGYLWTQKTADEILLDLNNIVNNIMSLTKGVERPNRLLMPVAQYTLIATKRISTISDTTVLEYFNKVQPGVVVDWVPEFAGLLKKPSDGTTSAGIDIMVAFEANPDKLTLEIPQPYEQLPIEQRGMEYVVITHSRFGGVIAYYPLSVSIVEGI